MAGEDPVGRAAEHSGRRPGGGGRAEAVRRNRGFNGRGSWFRVSTPASARRTVAPGGRIGPSGRIGPGGGIRPCRRGFGPGGRIRLSRRGFGPTGTYSGRDGAFIVEPGARASPPPALERARTGGAPRSRLGRLGITLAWGLLGLAALLLLAFLVFLFVRLVGRRPGPSYERELRRSVPGRTPPGGDDRHSPEPSHRPSQYPLLETWVLPHRRQGQVDVPRLFRAGPSPDGDPQLRRTQLQLRASQDQSVPRRSSPRVRLSRQEYPGTFAAGISFHDHLPQIHPAPGTDQPLDALNPAGHRRGDSRPPDKNATSPAARCKLDIGTGGRYNDVIQTLQGSFFGIFIGNGFGGRFCAECRQPGIV